MNPPKGYTPKRESITKTGNITVIKKYETSILDKFYTIWMERNLDKAEVQKSLEQRNTGFHLTWYFEDGEGNRVEIENEGSFKTQTGNKRFITFMNIVYEAVTKHNVSPDTLWDTAKRYRVDYIYKVDEEVPDCRLLEVTTTEDYFDFFSSDLDISFILQDQPVYNDNITDSLLSDGFQLFHYIARCQDMDQNSHKKVKAALKTFKDGSTMKILETANEIRNMDKTQQTGKDIWKESSAGKLMKKLNEIFGLNIYKLEVLSSTEDNLEDIRDEVIRKSLDICMEKGNCEELKIIVSEYGE